MSNLIKEYLLEYTQQFAIKNIDKKLLKKINVNKVYFDYEFEKKNKFERHFYWLKIKMFFYCLLKLFELFGF